MSRIDFQFLSTNDRHTSEWSIVLDGHTSVGSLYRTPCPFDGVIWEVALDEEFENSLDDTPAFDIPADADPGVAKRWVMDDIKDCLPEAA